MCKVLKDYGVVADHDSKVLKLQIIFDKEKKLALVSYKDGMSVGYRDFSREDAKQMREYLADYLGYDLDEPEDEDSVDATENKRDVVKTLTTLPSGDVNYQTALREATKEDLEIAISYMKESGGRHSTRIKTCENALRRMGSSSKSEPINIPTALKQKEIAEVKPEVKQEEKIYEYPSDDKKPVIIPLKTKGNRTYAECAAKLAKESETFIDGNSQYVIKGLLAMCEANPDFRNNLMREDKSFDGFIEYMFKAGMNGYYIQYGRQTWLDTDLSLALAIDYYNADLEQMKAEEEAKRKAEAEARKAKAEADKKAKKGAKKNGKNVGRKKGRVTA